ncbi:MAG: HXXEE domain-containing protein [Paludibacter sp.]|nr:HXXEE domain-containing protein [Paludibacter sp.]
MTKLNYKRQLLLAGILFTIHNAEEAIGFSYFKYPAGFPLSIHPPSTNAVLLSIGIITIIAWGLIMWANIQPKELFRKNLLIVFVAVFLVNSFFPHIVGTLVLQRYFPAVITSIVLYLPYAIWILPKLYRSYPHHNQFFIVMIGGLSLAALLALILHFFVNIFLRYLL